MKVEKLKSRINETETRMKNDSTKIKLLREKTKKNSKISFQYFHSTFTGFIYQSTDLEKMQTLEKIESVDTKIAVFQAKSYQLDAFISEEEIFQESVRKAIPVKPSNSCNYEDASMAVAKGLDVLKYFYDVHKDGKMNYMHDNLHTVCTNYFLIIYAIFNCRYGEAICKN